MLRTLNVIGDRMLARLLPATTAAAAPCPGVRGSSAGGCTYYCYHYSGDRSTQYRWCTQDQVCRVVGNDC
ncbi:hypothetical protein I0C86_04310 [Plantactinospora sp. S1510]|uniref:Uncharacterized protein n=1 Tax=Plantactinospora alkalitolerans TaxID=2789879 RepID=A0ABS0GPX3_9ACTN|nr:hypothetical protein [Plantactinospora alkalitolerans]MBF9128220.1 hypothetical protein [Plantactinospora alkalitolerans]